MIVLFSGTGNTRHVARLLADAIGEDVFELSAGQLREPESVAIDDSRRIIWAFPTYSWGIPPVMVDVIKKSKLSDACRQAANYMLTTCGDDMAYTDRQWRALMADRGLRAVQAYSVVMPNTYTLMKGFDVDTPDVVESKLKAVPQAVADIASSIEEGGTSILCRGSFPWIKSRIVYPWFVRHAMSPRPFHALAGCTGCGTCARACPMANIVMKKENDMSVPVWGGDCALCLRCYHVCPHHCVAYGKATIGKGQYRKLIK